MEMGAIQGLKSPIRSDLPFGFGLASSTALAISHLGAWDGRRVTEAVSETDAASNGFRPSGADYFAVCARSPGVFGTEGWTPLRIELPPGSHLVLPRPERAHSKLTPTLAMRADASTLGPLIDVLISELESVGQLDLETLLAYARRLADLGVYSSAQRLIIEPLLAAGIVAKGVGAMYDRAILVLCSPDVWGADPPGEILPQ
jgi:hypothetical protein